MTRDYFFARINEILDRDDSSDVPALKLTLEKNCKGVGYFLPSQGEPTTDSYFRWWDLAANTLESRERAVTECTEILRGTRSIHAIKRWRELTGDSIVDSKKEVDALKMDFAITVGELAGELGVKVGEVLKSLMAAGVTAPTMNHQISFDQACTVRRTLVTRGVIKNWSGA